MTPEPKVIVRLDPGARMSGPARAAARKVSKAALYGGTVVLLAAIARTIWGGERVDFLLASVAVGLLVVSSLLLYAQLRVWNCAIYLRDSSIGIINAFGVRREMPLASVGGLQKTTEMVRGIIPMAVLLVVRNDGQAGMRFINADRLQRGGLESLARAANIPIRGQWAHA